MALPDVIVKILNYVTSRSLPTNTATLFAGGVTERGPSGSPRACHSLGEWIEYFGNRLSNNPVYDWVETFFNEGGSELVFQRVFAVLAKPAKLELKHSSEVSLIVEAGQSGEVDPGTWGNALKVAVVVAGGKFTLQTSEGSTLLEESPALTTQAEMIAWANKESKYLVLTLGSTTEPPSAITATSLSGGTVGTVATSDYTLAAAKIPEELGPGQFAFPGQTAAEVQLTAIAHCVANNRFALLDAANTGSDATLIAAAQALYGAPSSGRRWGQLFAPWDVIPGITPFTQREVPPSARAAAQYAKVDALGNPNRGAAGPQRGVAQFVEDLSQPAWTAEERLALNNAGVTVSRRRFGNSIQTYGVRTLADQVNDESWSFAPGVRTIMAFTARAQAAGEQVDFDQIDGFGHQQTKLAGLLTGIAADFFGMGALYGKTPEEAFNINVGENVNTPKTIEEGKLIGQAALKVSDTDEQVIVNVIKIPVSQEI